jgi:membrane-associated phospholipid phosphatase
MTQQPPSGLLAQAGVWRDQLRADLRPTTPHQALRLAAWAFVIATLFVPLIRETSTVNDVAFPVVLIMGMAALLWVAPRNDLRTWVFYFVSMYFFIQLRDAADETAIAASTDYVLEWETSWFGVTPSAWLQDHVGGANGETNAISFLATFVHWSWFVFPHALVFGVYFFARPLFFRVAAIMIGTFFVAVALYYLAPTVPPWLAAEQGATGHIQRIITDTGPQILGQTLSDNLFSILAEPNPSAAMPSLHFAAAAILLFLSYLLRARVLTMVAMFYTVAMAFSLIYLGEHYFADIFVGGLVAIVAAFIVETALGNGPGKRYVVPLRARLKGTSARVRDATGSPAFTPRHEIRQTPKGH